MAKTFTQFVHDLAVVEMKMGPKDIKGKQLQAFTRHVEKIKADPTTVKRWLEECHKNYTPEEQAEHDQTGEDIKAIMARINQHR